MCLIDRKDFRLCSCVDPLIMRNRTNYENAVKDFALCTANSHQTGVIKSCLLNLYKYFHISENLILDAMHDFLECVPFMIKLLLKELISLPGFIPEL